MFNFEPANYIENEAKDSQFFVVFEQSILTFSNETFLRAISEDELKWSYIEEIERPVSYTHLTLPTNREV